MSTSYKLISTIVAMSQQHSREEQPECLPEEALAVEGQLVCLTDCSEEAVVSVHAEVGEVILSHLVKHSPENKYKLMS